MTSRAYSISCVPDRLTLGKKRRAGEASITVTNTSDRPIRTEVRLRALQDLESDRVSLASDDLVRDIAPGESVHYTAKVQLPAKPASGAYSFRLDAYSVPEPEEVFTEGPVVPVEVEAAGSDHDGGGSGIERWKIAIPVAALLVIGVAAWLLTRGGSASEFVFVSERWIDPAGDDAQKVEGEYVVRLSKEEDAGVVFAEFELRHVRTSTGEVLNPEVVDWLVGRKARLALGDLQNFDLAEEWQLEESSEGESSSEDVDNEEVGQRILKAIAVTQVSFDMRAILARRAEEMLLQEGNIIMATIRLRRPERQEAGAPTKFLVERRAVDADDFSEVGSAVYESESRLLRDFEMDYRPSDDLSDYRLRIQRTD